MTSKHQNFIIETERQVITTDPTNILIRSLLMKKERDARDRKAKEKAKAAAASATAVAAGGGAGGTSTAKAAKAAGEQQQRPAASGAKRGGAEPHEGEPSAKREAVDDGTAAGPSGRAARGAAHAAAGTGAAGTGATTAMATATGTAAPTEAQLSAMTKASLVDRARRAGLAVGGAKASLVSRLAEHYRTRRGS